MKPELRPRIFPDLFGWAIESGLSLKRCTPSEPRESTVVTICRDPLASRFDGKSSEPGVLDEISSRPSLATEIYENVPVALARMHDRAVQVSGVSDLLPSLKGLEETGLLLVPRLSGDTFGGFLPRRAYIT